MAQIAPPVPLTTQPRRLATNRDRSRQSTQTTAEAGPQAILSRGAVASRPRAVAPGAPARGLPFWRWCSLRSETAWFRAHSRLWRLVVRARPLARIAPSQARDATPAAVPRSHRRRLLPPLPPAPPLRPRPPRRTQPLDPRGRPPPVFMKTTDQPNGPTPGQTATGVPGRLFCLAGSYGASLTVALLVLPLLVLGGEPGGLLACTAVA